MARLHSDAATSGLREEINELKRQVRALKTALTLQSASIGAGGLSVVDEGEITVAGGALRVTDTARQTGVAFLGSAPGGDPIWAFSFDDGEVAFGLGGTPGATYWAGRDNAGNQLVANDALSGHGLARPYLNIPMYPSSGTSVGTGGPFWPEFTNTSYQEVWHGFTSLWHPRIAISVDTSTSSGTVEWEVRFDGTTAGSGSGADSGQFDVPGWGSTYTPGSDADVQLWCRNTTGVASRVVVDGCVGFQS